LLDVLAAAAEDAPSSDEDAGELDTLRRLLAEAKARITSLQAEVTQLRRQHKK
jgi:hypothetical protein